MRARTQPLDPESYALTMRPTHPQTLTKDKDFFLYLLLGLISSTPNNFVLIICFTDSYTIRCCGAQYGNYFCSSKGKTSSVT